jgi:hypothetical protein
VPSGEPSNVPSGEPTSLPSVFCAPGSYEPRGYITDENDACSLCAGGTFSSTAGATSCTNCPGISHSAEGAASSSDCEFTSLHFSLQLLLGAVVVVVVMELVVFCVDRPAKHVVQYGVVVALSSFDVFSDLMFILTSVFYREWLLLASVVVFSLPAIHFGWITYRKIVNVSGEGGKWLQAFRSFFSFVVLTMPNGYPHFLGKRVFCFDDIGGEAAKWLVYVIVFIVCAALQVCSSIVWIVIHIPYYFVCFAFGYVLHAFKLNQNNNTSKRWFKYVLNQETYGQLLESIPAGEDIDVKASNNAVVGELVLESIPQTCLVLLNSRAMHTLTLIELISIAGSALIIFNCLFKFGYWRLWMGVSLRHIPLSGRPDEQHMRHSSFKTRLDEIWVDDSVGGSTGRTKAATALAAASDGSTDGGSSKTESKLLPQTLK